VTRSTSAGGTEARVARPKLPPPLDLPGLKLVCRHGRLLVVGQVDGHLQYQLPRRSSGDLGGRKRARSCGKLVRVSPRRRSTPFTTPDFPPPLDVPYSWRDPGRPIELYTGELELLDKQGRLAQGAGVVSLNWRPQPAVLFTIPDQALRREIGERPRLRIRPLDLRADVHLSSWNRLRGDIKGIINRAPFPARRRRWR
jgi:hypothetical protein